MPRAWTLSSLLPPCEEQKNQYFLWLGWVGASKVTEIKIYHIVCGEIRSNKYILNRNASDNKHKESFFVARHFIPRTKADCVKAIYVGRFHKSIASIFVPAFISFTLSMTCFFRPFFHFKLFSNLNSMNTLIFFFVRLCLSTRGADRKYINLGYFILLYVWHHTSH